MDEFLWGVATSSYQIEGASKEDGKGASIWDTFCEKYPERIADRKDASISCDHYHHMREDVAIIQQLGINAYRFSISWPRILPKGIGEINPLGIECYQNLIQELLQKGITPFLTLYHWDLPEALQEKGGWLNPESPEWFASYAKVVAKYFGKQVKYMVTFNEPQVFMGEFVSGKGAPGKKSNKKEVLQMAHHVLLAHGRAVQEIRKIDKSIQIGYAPTFAPYYPVNEKEESIQEARKRNFEIKNKKDYMWNITWWSDPILLGHYPEDGVTLFGKDMPEVTNQDMKIIAEPIDFYAQNIYYGNPVGGGRKQKGKTAMNWPMDPEVLYWGTKFLYERYQKPIFITENGVAFEDVISPDGKVHDQDRIQFLEKYIDQLLKAKQEGIPVKGYFIWSLFDNFEWLNGYTKRFGIVYIDYETQKRIIKDSGYWYENKIAQYKKENS